MSRAVGTCCKIVFVGLILTICIVQIPTSLAQLVHSETDF